STPTTHIYTLSLHDALPICRIISVSFSEHRTKSKFFLPWPPTAASFPNACQFSPQEDHFEKTASNSSASRSSNQHLVSYSRVGKIGRAHVSTPVTRSSRMPS